MASLRIDDRRTPLSDSPAPVRPGQEGRLKTALEVAYERMGLPPPGRSVGLHSLTHDQREGGSGLLNVHLMRREPALPARGKGWERLELTLGLSRDDVARNPILSHAVRQAASAQGRSGTLSAKEANAFITSFSLGLGPVPKVATPTAAQISEAVKALHQAWPPAKPRPADAPADWRPPPPEQKELRPFGERALALDRFKTNAVAALLVAPLKDRPAKTKELLAALEEIHGKKDHGANLEKAIELYLKDPPLAAAICGRFSLDAKAYASMLETVRSAVPLIDIGEAFTPTAVLAAHRPLTKEERTGFIEPHPAASAELAARIGLADETLVEVLAHHAVYRPYASIPKADPLDDLSKSAPIDTSRSVAAQVIDLLDQITALSEKRFFRSAEGGLLKAKVCEELKKNATSTRPDGTVDLLRDPVLLLAFIDRVYRV